MYFIASDPFGFVNTIGFVRLAVKQATSLSVNLQSVQLSHLELLVLYLVLVTV